MALSVLGVIPARGGSKGILRKNIASLAGRPLIAWTLDAVRSSRNLTRCVVSTDDREIASIATELGGDVPFIRPSELATDTAQSLPVLQHALAEVERASRIVFDAVIMLQPTAPLRSGKDIDSAIDLLARTGADSVVSVVDVAGMHPLRMKRVVAGDRLINWVDQGYEDMRPRQELPPVFIRSGAIYAVKREVLLEGSIVGSDCRALVMDPTVSINIDGPDDWILAEHYLSKR